MKKPVTYEGLFKADIDWNQNACINQCSEPLDIYTQGYLEAANFLCEHAADGGQQDLFIYPIEVNQG